MFSKYVGINLYPQLIQTPYEGTMYSALGRHMT